MNLLKKIFGKKFETIIIEDRHNYKAINIGRARIYAKYKKYFGCECTAYEREDGIIVVYIEKWYGLEFVIDTKILVYQTEKIFKEHMKSNSLEFVNW
jgi:hypothetical protein